MTSTTYSLRTDYLKWLTDNIIETSLENGWKEIATPFLDSFNDGITIYAHETGDIIMLSDDGMTASNTISLGEKPKPGRLSSFKKFLEPYGIKVTADGEMQMESTRNRFPLHFHMFLQAVMSAHDMFTPQVRSQNISHIFKDEIIRFFDACDVAYSQDVKLEGQSGIIHEVGFILPKRKHHPERLIYALNNPSRQNTELTLFNWSDIQKKRGTESNMIAFLNDTDKPPSPSIIQAFHAYEATPVLWSQRDTYKDRLAV